MAKLGTTFTADTEKKTSFEPLPAGWYTATITESTVVDVKAPKTGTYIKNRYDILGPTHAGRVVFGNITLTNSNPAAEEMGAKQLNDLLCSIGKAKCDDTDELIGKSMEIKLVVKSSEQYGDGNEVKGFRAIKGSQMPGAGSPGATLAAKAKAPWEK